MRQKGQTCLGLEVSPILLKSCLRTRLMDCPTVPPISQEHLNMPIRVGNFDPILTFTKKVKINLTWSSGPVRSGPGRSESTRFQLMPPTFSSRNNFVSPCVFTVSPYLDPSLLTVQRGKETLTGRTRIRGCRGIQHNKLATRHMR